MPRMPMPDSFKFCVICGEKIPIKAWVCSHCKAYIKPTQMMQNEQIHLEIKRTLIKQYLVGLRKHPVFRCMIVYKEDNYTTRHLVLSGGVVIETRIQDRRGRLSCL